MLSSAVYWIVYSVAAERERWRALWVTEGVAPPSEAALWKNQKRSGVIVGGEFEDRAGHGRQPPHADPCPGQSRCHRVAMNRRTEAVRSGMRGESRSRRMRGRIASRKGFSHPVCGFSIPAASAAGGGYCAGVADVRAAGGGAVFAAGTPAAAVRASMRAPSYRCCLTSS